MSLSERCGPSSVSRADDVIPAALLFSVQCRVCVLVSPGLEVTEDADVGELFAVAVRGQRQEEGPLQTHQAPHAGQVQAARVRQRLFGVDADGQEGDEGDDGDDGKGDSDTEEELEALQPGPPEVLQVHDVCDESPQSQHT